MEVAADLIIRSGRVWDGRHLEEVEALAIAGGRILATGTNRQIDRLRADRTRVIDARGRRVIPGLIDSHLHLLRAGLTWNRDVHWYGISSLTEGLAAIAEIAKRRDRGEWVAVLGGWSPLQFAEQRPPTRAELDETAPEHPVFVQRNYIEAFCNTAALEVMGWPPQSEGRVSGAAQLQPLRARLANLQFEEQVTGTQALLRRLNQWGLTGCIDAGGFGMTPATHAPITELRRRGGLGFRARLLVGAAQSGDEGAQIEDWMNRVGPGHGDDHLRYLGAGEVLLFAAHDMEGLERRDISAQRERLVETTRRLIAAGWPIHLHAILEESVTVVLDAWEMAGVGTDSAHLRLTLTHADQVSRASLERIRAMGLGVTIQNGMAFRGVDSVLTWGEDRVRQSPPLRTMVEMGIPMGAGTDATVVSSPNPWGCIRWMVSGKGFDASPPRDPQQLLSRDEALRLYTSGSAWFSFEEEVRGNLRPGSHADVAVLSADPLTISEDRLSTIESVLTVVGGEVVHSSLPAT